MPDAGHRETTQIVVERPPPGLASGRWAWPSWAVLGLGGALVAVALAWALWRWRRA